MCVCVVVCFFWCGFLGGWVYCLFVCFSVCSLWLFCLFSVGFWRVAVGLVLFFCGGFCVRGGVLVTFTKKQTNCFLT